MFLEGASPTYLTTDCIIESRSLISMYRIRKVHKNELCELECTLTTSYYSIENVLLRDVWKIDSLHLR